MTEGEHPGDLVALGTTGAAIALPDGTLAAIYTTGHGTADELREQLANIVSRNPGKHLKLCILGGEDEAQTAVAAAQPRISLRRAVQAFHLADDGTLWTGRNTRADSAFGRALAAAVDAEAEAPTFETLATRIRGAEMSPAQAAAMQEGRAFVDRIKATKLRATPAMLGVLLVAFALQQWFGGSIAPVLIRMGASTPAGLAGEPERFLAAAFLHGGLVHFGLNGYVLWILGGFIERLLGGAHTVTIMVLAALTGGVTSVLLTQADLGVGASGGIWGLLGAAAVLAFLPQGVLHPTVVPSIRRAAITNLVLAGAISFVPGVDLWAHLGGGIAGAAYVVAMRPHFAAVGTHERPTSRAATIFAAILAVIAISSFAVALLRGRAWELRDPIQLVDRELTAGVHLPVPLTTTEPKRYPPTPEDPTELWRFGDLRHDPLVVLVSLTAHDVEPEHWESELAELAAEPPPVPEGAEADGPWRVVSGAELPTLQTSWSSEEIVGQMLVVIRPTVLLQIQTRHFSDGPQAATDAAAAIAEAASRP